MRARFLLGTVVFCLGAGFTTGAPDGDDLKAVKDEMDKLNGEWRIVAVEQNGGSVESAGVVRFAGEKCTITHPGSGIPDIETTITLDPTKTPKWMDVKTAKPKANHRGIYELKGDTLKAVFQADETGPRPTNFKPKVGDKLVMYTYERVKK